MVTLKESKYTNKMTRMTNVKAQIPSECQMTKPKTNNRETIRRRWPVPTGKLWRDRRKNESTKQNDF
jgi:hypothetical protein